MFVLDQIHPHLFGQSENPHLGEAPGPRNPQSTKARATKPTSNLLQGHARFTSSPHCISVWTGFTTRLPGSHATVAT